MREERIAWGGAVASISLAVAVAGCSSSAQYNFRPYSVRTDDASVVGSAVVFYEGDMPVLRDAGARYIGTLQVVSSHSVESPEARLRVELEAAEAGGTHLIPSDAPGAERVTTWTGAAESDPGGSSERSGEAARSHSPVPSGGAAYYVVRVPKSAFAQLPEQLNPLSVAGLSCGIGELRQALIDGPSCLQELEGSTADVLIDADGTIRKLDGVEGEAKRCLAHVFGPVRVEPPGREVRCTVRITKP